MNHTSLVVALALSIAAQIASAHLIGDPAHDGQPVQYAQNVAPPTNVIRLRSQSLNASGSSRATQIAAAFAPFAPKVKTHADEKYFWVESDGLPAHNMMVGITARADWRGPKVLKGRKIATGSPNDRQ